MSKSSDLFGSAGKPKLITSYTSSTGTYVPTADMARCLVRLQAGGGGGYNSGANGGGGGGAFAEFWVLVPIAGIAWAVGAGGAATIDGSPTTFGSNSAMGGRAATGSSSPGHGGVLSSSSGSVDADSATIINSVGLSGASGGAGGYTLAGGQVGHSTPINSNFSTVSAYTAVNGWFGNGQGTASGGNSFYGKGGTTGNAPAADAYGAGGGYNAAGRGGKIEIWDFGA
jgi:hypothetical protein